MKQLQRKSQIWDTERNESEQIQQNRSQLTGCVILVFQTSLLQERKDSVNNGIDFIQDFKIIIHPRCVNFITEISNYTWDTDKFGKKLNIPIDDFNHLMDAMRYALEDFVKGRSFSFE